MPRQRANIPGLVPVQPPEREAKQPGLLTEAELKAMNNSGGPLRFFNGMLPIEDVQDALLSIHAQLQFFSDVEQNPALIGLEDFNIGVVKLRAIPGPNGYVDPGPSIVLQNPKHPARYTVVAAYPPPGVSLSSFHYATAVSLIELAKDPEPISA